ncbi:MAG: hypothetical protein V4726_18620 [Verrucomicrobiota bacterium]
MSPPSREREFSGKDGLFCLKWSAVIAGTLTVGPGILVDWNSTRVRIAILASTLSPRRLSSRSSARFRLRFFFRAPDLGGMAQFQK